MKWLWICLMIWPAAAVAQSREVLPRDLDLRVEVEETAYTPFVREMVMITIHGVYRRHITRESLQQPDLKGFSWTQLGDDLWREERINGEQVKTFRRRMAIYPDRAGTLTIGAFAHNLTLTDESDDWFDYQITSEPVTLEVAPAPPGHAWWFPVKHLKVSDNWSNAPDQLAPGEGVLRTIRVEALGVTPESIPPMPALTSPSAMIFPHPEKRFVELTPFGPVSYAFWRWTIRPGNDTSTIVEPISFDYFDSTNRVDRTATISAQRVAFGVAVPHGPAMRPPDPLVKTTLPGWPLAMLGLLVFAGGAAAAVSGRRLTGVRALERFAPFDPLARKMRQAARKGQVAPVRQAASGLLSRDGHVPARAVMLATLDRAIFSRAGSVDDLRAFARRFVALKGPGRRGNKM